MTRLDYLGVLAAIPALLCIGFVIGYLFAAGVM